MTEKGKSIIDHINSNRKNYITALNKMESGMKITFAIRSRNNAHGIPERQVLSIYRTQMKDKQYFAGFLTEEGVPIEGCGKWFTNPETALKHIQHLASTSL